MATSRGAGVAPSISDDAVLGKTGKHWTEWFDLLDSLGAEAMPHKAIAAHLQQHEALSGWWSQMVTVTYEQARGLRQKHQRPEGFQISRSATLNSCVDDLLTAWVDAEVRDGWLPDVDVTLRKSRRPRTIRMEWHGGSTRVEVRLVSKGDRLSQVTVQHSKLPSTAEAERMKVYWAAALERLREVAERGSVARR